MDKNTSKVDKNNMQNPSNQLQPINDLSRFGHSVTLLNSNNAVLFGGAKVYSSNYDIKNDTYIFKIQENTWVKISPVGDIPPPRAAHSACAINEEHLAIFGGAGLAGELVPDDLYILEISLNKNNCTWYKIPTEGPGPKKIWTCNYIL